MAADPKQTLIELIASYALDPLGFVLFAFPWGEAGTELADATGPREWQRALLAELGRRLQYHRPNSRRRAANRAALRRLRRRPRPAEGWSARAFPRTPAGARRPNAATVRFR